MGCTGPTGAEGDGVASCAYVTLWLWCVGRVTFLCLSFPIFQSSGTGEEEVYEVSLAASKGAGLAPVVTSRHRPCWCQLHSLPWTSSLSSGGSVLAQDITAAMSQHDAHIFLGVDSGNKTKILAQGLSLFYSSNDLWRYLFEFV